MQQSESSRLDEMARPAVRLHVELWVEDRERIRQLVEDYGPDAVLEWLLPREDVMRYVRSVFMYMVEGSHAVSVSREPVA